MFFLQEDKKLWLSSSAGAAELDIEMSCFLLREIGDQFCELLQQEKEAESHHLNEGTFNNISLFYRSNFMKFYF